MTDSPVLLVLLWAWSRCWSPDPAVHASLGRLRAARVVMFVALLARPVLVISVLIAVLVP